MGNTMIINEDTLTDIADAVRYRTGTFDKMTPSEMIEKLNKPYMENYDLDLYSGLRADEWVRPAEWPDLDSLNLEMSGDDYIYMTYENNDIGAIVWYLQTSDKQPANCDIGHIENGVFIVDEHTTVASGQYFTRNFIDLPKYFVVRITGNISQCRTSGVTVFGRTQALRQQPMVERIAYVPHLTLFTSTSSAWGTWFLQRDRVGNGDGTALISIANMYTECEELQSLDISELKTPNVTTFYSAFNSCLKLSSLDLSKWSTNNVTTTGGMFNGCRSIKTINISGWITSKINTIYNMFSDCRSLTEIKGIKDLNVSNVTGFNSAFNNCYSLKELPIENWDTTKGITMASMFFGCRTLEKLDLSKWNVNNITNTGSMFSGCYSLKYLNLTGWETDNLTSVGSMFYDCHSLQEIDISGLKVTNVCTNIGTIFSGCWSLKELHFPVWDVSGLSNSNNMAYNVFANCYSLERITGIKDWQFNLTNSISSMFSGCRSLKELDVSGWKVDTVTNISSMFQNCWSLKELDLSNWNPENCTTTASMFSGCYSLKSIGNISEWDTSNITNMSSMFSDCMSLENLPDLSNWDVAKVTTTANMFSGCSSLHEIIIHNWNLASCTTIATMFRYCYNLEYIDLTGWQIPKVTATAPAQFLGDCPNLQDLDLFPIPLNHSYANDRRLSYDALIKILNTLPTVSTSRTLNLVSTNIGRLSDEERQIATNKNWTLAN